MIKSFRHKGLRLLWEKGDGIKLPTDQVTRIERMLNVIDAAQLLPQDFEVYKNWNLHKLSGKWKGFRALKVTGNYRIVFRFEGQNAYEIDYLDYH